MKKNFLGKVLSIILTLTMLGGLSGCGKSSSTITKTEQVKKNGKLIIGTCADYPPYEFHKTGNGKDEIVGFDITIAKEIAKDLGVQLEIKDMSFDGLLAALQAGTVDMVIAGMNPTDERKKSVDFSTVYYKAINTVIVRTEDKDKYKTAADINGKSIGVQKGTVQEALAKDQMPDSSLKSLGKVTDLVLQLQSKKVDAIIVEKPVASSYVSKNTDLTISDIVLENDDKGAAVAIKKGNENFVQAVNSTLDRLMKDGSIDQFVADANK